MQISKIPLLQNQVKGKKFKTFCFFVQSTCNEKLSIFYLFARASPINQNYFNWEDFSLFLKYTSTWRFSIIYYIYFLNDDIFKYLQICSVDLKRFSANKRFKHKNFKFSLIIEILHCWNISSSFSYFGYKMSKLICTTYDVLKISAQKY